MCLIACLGFVLLATQKICAQGTLVQNGISVWQSGDSTEVDLKFYGDGGPWAGISFVPGDQSWLFRVAPTLTFDTRTYFVNYGDSISADSLSGNKSELTAFNQSTFLNNRTYYLGISIGQSTDQDSQYLAFAWLEVKNVGGVMQVLDGALETGGPGLYAGTWTLVPEPSTFALAGLGLAGMLFLRRRKEPCER